MRLEHGLKSEAVLDLGSLPCQKLGVFFERCSNSKHAHSHEIRYFPSQLAPVPLESELNEIVVTLVILK